MAVNSVIPGTTSQVVSAPATNNNNTTTNKSNDNSGIDGSTIAGNFQTFLTLLTTQLQNQDPLSPLDTNQFTQQLVSFAEVEQQLKSNSELSTLVSLQQTAQNTAALNFVGQTVTVTGSTATVTNGSATWELNVPKPASGNITITAANGQTVYTGSYSMDAGLQSFTWNGKDNNGTQWPDGNYTISITAQDASGAPVSVPTQIEGLVDSADLSQTPPVLSIDGQNYTLDKITRVVRSSGTN